MGELVIPVGVFVMLLRQDLARIYHDDLVVTYENDPFRLILKRNVSVLFYTDYVAICVGDLVIAKASEYKSVLQQIAYAYLDQQLAGVPDETEEEEGDGGDTEEG